MGALIRLSTFSDWSSPPHACHHGAAERGMPRGHREQGLTSTRRRRPHARSQPHAVRRTHELSAAGSSHALTGKAPAARARGWATGHEEGDHRTRRLRARSSLRARPLALRSTRSGTCSSSCSPIKRVPAVSYSGYPPSHRFRHRLRIGITWMTTMSSPSRISPTSSGRPVSSVPRYMNSSSPSGLARPARTAVGLSMT